MIFENIFENLEEEFKELLPDSGSLLDYVNADVCCELNELLSPRVL